MRQRLLPYMTLLTLVMAYKSLRADTTTISVLPASQTISLGAPVNIALSITGLGNLTTPSLGTFDLNLAFDPTLLSFSSVVFGDPLLGDQLDPTGLGNTLNFATQGLGTIELFDLSLDSPNQLNTLQYGAFILASVSFNTIGAGTSTVDLTINSLGDADGNALAAGLQGGDVTVTNISAAPEPRSFVLLAMGLIVLATSQRRRRRPPRR